MISRTPPPDFKGYAVWSYELPDVGKIKLVHYPTKLYGWRWFDYSDAHQTNSTGQYATPEIALENVCHFLGLDTHHNTNLTTNKDVLEAWRKYVAENA